MKKATLFVTCGDPLSVSIECMVSRLIELSRRMRVIYLGSRDQLLYQARLLSPSAEILNALESARVFEDLNGLEESHDTGLIIVDRFQGRYSLDPRRLTEVERAKIVIDSLSNVPREWPGPIAVVTGPIDKHIAKQGGFSFPGQTEFFEKLWGGDAVMLLAGPKLRVALATNHMALNQVTESVTSEHLKLKLKTLAQWMKKYADVMPGAGENSKRNSGAVRIAVAGLNPHLGDSGMFGDHDSKIVHPAIKEISQLFNGQVEIAGPFPADTVFFRAYSGEFDCVLAMYHDQGLAPLKLVHFYDAVNISVGLSYLRVSPDHGPASELYGQNKANKASFEMAFDVALRWLNKVDGGCS